MALQYRIESRLLVVSLKGTLDDSSKEQLAACLSDVLAANPAAIILDLGDVEIIQIEAIPLLAEMTRQFRDEGGRKRDLLIAAANSNIRGAIVGQGLIGLEGLKNSLGEAAREIIARQERAIDPAMVALAKERAAAEKLRAAIRSARWWLKQNGYVETDPERSEARSGSLMASKSSDKGVEQVRIECASEQNLATNAARQKMFTNKSWKEECPELRLTVLFVPVGYAEHVPGILGLYDLTQEYMP